jgi:hypothetical protein
MATIFAGGKITNVPIVMLIYDYHVLFIFLVEYQVLRRHHNTLVNNLESIVSSLSDKCFSKKLISDKNRSKVLQPNQKVDCVLKDVELTVKQNPAKFKEFLNVLSDLSCCDDLVKKLETDLHKVLVIDYSSC